MMANFYSADISCAKKLSASNENLRYRLRCKLHFFMQSKSGIHTDCLSKLCCSSDEILKYITVYKVKVCNLLIFTLSGETALEIVLFFPARIIVSFVDGFSLNQPLSIVQRSHDQVH